MEIQKRRPGKQSNLPVADIKQMLDEGMRQVDVAMIYGVTQGTISRIARLPEKPRGKPAASVSVCSCCGVRPIAKENRFLCAVCYRSENVETNMVWA